MNDILQLKGHFEQKKNSSAMGTPNIPKGKKVELIHIVELKEDLLRILKEWEEITLEINPLVSAYYIDVMAKSNRIKCLFTKTRKTSNDSIVGVKFSNQDNPKHIITYYLERAVIRKAIRKLEEVENIIKNQFSNSFISYDDIELINNNKKKLQYNLLTKTSFVNSVVDSYYVQKFGIEKNEELAIDSKIVSLYETGKPVSDLMRMLEIKDFKIDRSLDNTTILLRPDQYNKLINRAPFLVSMAVSNISELDKEDFEFDNEKINFTIPYPSNEPIIGVIDTMFYKGVYFSSWVEFEDDKGRDFSYTASECIHGTKVTSIIVDGPTLNPELEDGCGHFRVKHFGLSTGGPIGTFGLLKLIKKIVVENREIKVWNLSLGGIFEVNSNFISPEAAVLDQIQFENDVIFVISGTNKSSKVNKSIQKIGPPADSINSLVVNSVDFNNRAASYSREGRVLSFYIKPDVSYYGGDKGQGIWAYSPYDEKVMSYGTSFAAPWISRKLAYMINILGFSREVSKALIIDSATGWNNISKDSKLLGYGVVPRKLEDIVKSKDDEIRFILSGISEKYEAYNFNLPVPIQNDKCPYIAKATLCYFPKCSRNQGVDYTNTEMDLHFGRIKDNKVKTINDNEQDEIHKYTYEGNARKYYRKWDNVKHVSEIIKKRVRPKKVYDNRLWGISLKTKERLNDKSHKDLKFGVVVTLKEINGVNRIEDFIHQCSFRGWIVNKIDLNNILEIYNKSQEEIKFED
ncbi:MAG: S8 family peptidase [Sphaerochaetaceae bacterium]